jgi:calcium-independent phospholipase A2-gamma
MLDGGGVRGLSSLLILKRLMYSLGSAMTPEREDLEPWQYFDLIGGTSTGGIIAVMLGRLRMSVDECIAEYEKLSAFVFREKKVGKPELFKAKKLEEAIKAVIKKKLGEDMEDAPLLDPLKEECCKT